jgi:hypothetical protein
MPATANGQKCGGAKTSLSEHNKRKRNKTKERNPYLRSSSVCSMLRPKWSRKPARMSSMVCNERTSDCSSAKRKASPARDKASNPKTHGSTNKQCATRLTSRDNVSMEGCVSYTVRRSANTPGLISCLNKSVSNIQGANIDKNTTDIISNIFIKNTSTDAPVQRTNCCLHFQGHSDGLVVLRIVSTNVIFVGVCPEKLLDALLFKSKRHMSARKLARFAQQMWMQARRAVDQLHAQNFAQKQELTLRAFLHHRAQIRPRSHDRCSSRRLHPVACCFVR